jgi:hypothetical protein
MLAWYYLVTNLHLYVLLYLQGFQINELLELLGLSGL